MNDKEQSLAFPQNSIFEMHVCEMEKQTEDCAIDEEAGGGDPSDRNQSLIRTYDEMRQKVANQIQKMTQELQNVLRPTRAAKWKDGYTSGSKVNLKRMIQREARNQGDLDFWQRKTQVSKRSVAATLLIDLSGSMHGSNRNRLCKARYCFGNLFSRLELLHLSPVSKPNAYQFCVLEIQWCRRTVKK